VNDRPAATTVLTISYDGSRFHGFARQDGPETVQGNLEAALRIALRREVALAVAGRTDTGVHALGQVVSFTEGHADPPARELLRSLNALVGPGIVVTGTHRAAPAFDARHSALCREYRYRIVTGPVPPLFLGGRSWWVKGSLDLGKMREGALALLGEHDFRSFCVTASAEGRRTVREVETLEIAPSQEMGEHCIVVRITGRSFLHSMVRIVVGSLVEVGKGRRDPAWITQALAACDRAAAGPTAPPEGLTLWHVTYPDEMWL
jgi:tRNA pseudouridine38-40 synthase